MAVSRVQLALNVDDLDTAIGFYSKLFATEPAKVRPGYANFAIAEPPLKLVLIEGDGPGGTLNHLGVEVESTGEVAAAQQRWPPRVSRPRPKTRSRVATRCRTRCGSTARRASRGRSTPCLSDVEMPGGQLRTVDPETGASCCAVVDGETRHRRDRVLLTRSPSRSRRRRSGGRAISPTRPSGRTCSTAAERSEICRAVAHAQAAGDVRVRRSTRDDFPLPRLEARIDEWADDAAPRSRVRARSRLPGRRARPGRRRARVRRARA